jgi:hypothetical protein
MNFPKSSQDAANRKVADATIKQFDSTEFNIACKEVILGKPIVAYGDQFTVHHAEYRSMPVTAKIIPVDEENQVTDITGALVDLTSFASLPHESIAAFYGAGFIRHAESQKQQVRYGPLSVFNIFSIIFLLR